MSISTRRQRRTSAAGTSKSASSSSRSQQQAPRQSSLPPGENQPATANRSLLRPLGIVGYNAVEPAILAALATEEPLLLVSEHGAAKTLLLVRLAEALGVELRHYNASLLQFDDLAGFPVPDDRGGIRYAAPPGAIWDAEAVFIDEIGRCRPETANKLFPIVHERRIQGIELERLRFRWAATNPPPEAQDGDDDQSAGAFGWAQYEGVEVLDPALADRFSYVVPLPRFADLSDADRALVIGGAGDRPSPVAAAHVRELVAATRELLATLHESERDAATDYVVTLVPRLEMAGVAAGGRRAATLRRNVLALRAAYLSLGLAHPAGLDDEALGADSGAERAACAALLASIPDVVRRRVPRATLLAAHKAAWREAAIPESDPKRILFSVRDATRRATLAITLPGLAADLRGEALTGALAEMHQHQAEILAWHIFPRVLSAGSASDGGLPATAIEMVGEIVGRVATGGAEVRGFGTQRDWALEVRRQLAASGVPAQEVEYLHGVLVRAFTLPQAATGLAPNTGVDVLVRQSLGFRTRCLMALGNTASGSMDDVEVLP